ncbi:MAG: hypothetical protein HY898_09015 [Deltaproteobacteria bacterium]|nr:hypothetical protein [Deltaproteobacteria bacterium]
MNQPSPSVRRGSIRCYRLFDLGDEIDLSEIVKNVGVGAVRSTHLQRRGVRAMEFIAVPVRIDLGKRPVPLSKFGPHVEAQVELHLFSFGSASICIRIPIPPGTTLESMIPLIGPLYESRDLEELSRKELHELLPKIRPHITGYHSWKGCETYTILDIQEIDGAPTAQQVLAWPRLANLILGETREGQLSEGKRREVVGHAFSYFEHDLAVIEWNSAFLLDPAEDSGIAEMLEFTNTQLLSLRYYDEVLEHEIDRVHKVLERGHRSRLFFSPYSRLAHDLFHRLVDLSARLDRIDNTIKVAGTWHLATAYHASLDRLLVTTWRQSIERKHELTSSAYSMLSKETEGSRSLWLEVTVVLLILVEIVLAVISGSH